MEHVAIMKEGRGAYKVLVGKPEGTKPLGRSRYRWEDNIKMYYQEIGWECVEWIYLAKDRNKLQNLVKALTNFGFS
jgi:hypothetical protein